MTKREKDMILFAYELFIETLVQVKDNRITIDTALERVKNAKDHMENIDTRQDYD